MNASFNFDVVGFFKTLDEHVVDIDFHVLIDLVLEDLVDQILVGGSCIF